MEIVHANAGLPAIGTSKDVLRARHLGYKLKFAELSNLGATHQMSEFANCPVTPKGSLGQPTSGVNPSTLACSSWGFVVC